MHHRGVRTERGDCVERFAKQRDSDPLGRLTAELPEIFVAGQLVKLAFAELQFDHQASHGEPVGDMAEAEIFKLGRILFRLHELGRICRVRDFTILKRIDNRRADRGFFKQDVNTGQLFELGVELVVVIQADPVALKLLGYLCQRAFVREQHIALGGDYRIGHEHRRVRDVRAAEVIKPRDIAERRQHERAAVIPGELFAQLRELFGMRATAVFNVKRPDFTRRQRRAVIPDQPGEVDVGGNVDSVKLARQRLGERCRYTAPVKRERHALAEL